MKGFVMKSFEEKIAAFGSQWNKAGAKRCYFNNLQELYGLKCVESDAGRVISATVDGEEVNVIHALLLKNIFAISELWFNFETSSFHYKVLKPELANKIISRIREQINGDAYHG